jgi:hypothetical protein
MQGRSSAEGATLGLLRGVDSGAGPMGRLDMEDTLAQRRDKVTKTALSHGARRCDFFKNFEFHASA